MIALRVLAGLLVLAGTALACAFYAAFSLLPEIDP